MLEQEAGRRDLDHHAPDFIADPWPVYAELRRSSPVARSERYGGFWLITRYEDVKAAAKDWPTFTSSLPNVTSIPSTHPRTEPDLPIELDPPLHTRYRQLVGPVFSRHVVEGLRPTIRQIVDDLLDDLVVAGGGDLVSGFAIPLSVGTLAAFMDFPKEDELRWVAWVRRMYDLRDPDDARVATDEYYAYIDELVEARRGAFVSLLLDSEVEGECLTASEVARFIRVLLIAGHETTAAALGFTLHHLARHPDDLRRLRDQPVLIPLAVEEFLRLSSPVTLQARNATCDLELHGQAIASGDVVALSFPSANRDEAEFPDAERCLLDRRPNRHIAFGFGPHLCAGAHVARLEMAVALEVLVGRVADLRPAEHAAPSWNPTGSVRGLATLPVTIRAMSR
jgi:cytochrome P450